VSPAHRNCSRCGSFMKKDTVDDYDWEDEVVQWWVCPRCGLNHPEHLDKPNAAQSFRDNHV